MMKINKRIERERAIKAYAECYHYPISDFKGFSKVLKQNLGYRTTKGKLIKILGY